MMRWFLISVVCVFCFSCTGRGGLNHSEKQEDIRAKTMLQGIWIDGESEMPLMRVIGDTVYHSNPQNAPTYFKIIKDSLYILGHTTTSYHIDRQTEHSFWFHTLSGNIIKLYRSEDLNDSLAFKNIDLEIIPVCSEVTQRDSVVFYNNTRYRAYAYINPSTMKVTKTVYSDEGLGVDNVYYDNVIHICVYKGSEKIYAKDITKHTLKNVISNDFLSNAILADINFVHVSSSGFLYQANVCIPESYVCQLVNLTINFDGKMNITDATQELLANIE